MRNSFIAQASVAPFVQRAFYGHFACAEPDARCKRMRLNSQQHRTQHFSASDERIECAFVFDVHLQILSGTNDIRN